jgi:mRNA interferase MazF
MKRGDVVIVSTQGDYGKPRPAVIVQADLVTSQVESVIVCLMTGTASNTDMVRLPVQPTADNGLNQTSYLMAEKIMTFPNHKIAKRVGRVDAKTMSLIDRTLALVLGLAD